MRKSVVLQSVSTCTCTYSFTQVCPYVYHRYESFTFGRISMIIHVLGGENWKHETIVCQTIGKFHKSMAARKVAMLKLLDKHLVNFSQIYGNQLKTHSVSIKSIKLNF